MEGGEQMSASGMPAEQAADLFNELVILPPSRTDRIAQIEWHLRGLSNRHAGDLAISVALIQARASLGDAEGAIAIAERIWPRRHMLGPDQRHTFIIQLASLGLYQKCIDFAQECLATGAVSDYALSIAAHSTWYIGDIASLRQLLNRTDGGSRRIWQAVLDSLDAYGLTAHMRDYRTIANKALYGKQCDTDLILTPADDFPITAAQFVHLRADRETRLFIEESLHEELDRFWAGRGLAEAPYWDLMPIVLLDTTAGAPANLKESRAA
jgi:hypothetical protein